MRKLKFSKEDLRKISNSVKEAESTTSGEIKVAFIKESYDYAKYEVIFALFTGIIYLITIFLFQNQVETIIRNMSWDYSPFYLTVFFGISPFVVMTIFYLVANIPFVDRLIIPGRIQRKKVNERAVRYFIESGVHTTRDRTGILIFLSFLEKRVELLADSGINARIPQEKWDGIVSHIIEGISSGNTVENLTESVLECGKLLSESENFPIKPDDTNELKDDVSILEE
ncbi:MAG: TPM domain-containing protein [Acidobacteriota bacterium]